MKPCYEGDRMDTELVKSEHYLKGYYSVSFTIWRTESCRGAWNSGFS